MKTARTRLAFSVLIVLAMISSGFGVGILTMRESTSAVSGPSGDLGTRTEGEPAMVSLTGTNMNEMQGDDLLIEQPSQDSSEATYNDAQLIDTNEVQKTETNQGQTSNGITRRIESTESIGTRDPFFDAGGPYGGPTCFEGTCTIHFEITTDDPSLIFFRWDFNNDGEWDTPWLTSMTYDKLFLDDVYGDVVAEGWDGISTSTYFEYGINMDEDTTYQWNSYPVNAGWLFRAKVDFDIIRLGYYRRSYYYGANFNIRIYHYTTQSMLGSCAPVQGANYRWHWCTLGSAVHITLGEQYMISYHKNYDYSPYWSGIYDYNLPEHFEDMFQYDGSYYYNWGLPHRMPQYISGSPMVVKVDFEWRLTVIVPLTQQDTAHLEVTNFVPEPFGIVTDPSPGLEGTVPVKFSGWFNDEGLDDTWQFRWYFGDGTWSNWMNVKKMSGGVNLLLYHSMPGYITDWKQDIIDTCGEFCLTVDDYDFGPLGTGVNMPLSDMMNYDVVWADVMTGPLPDPVGTGDLLADFMDAKGAQGSGGVVVSGRGPFNPGSWQIRGRWFTDGYSPVQHGTSHWYWKDMGTIYVPGHPILDGVTSIRGYAHSRTFNLNPGATRIVDWTDGSIMLATNENPIVTNGARAVAMPFRAWDPLGYCTGECVQINVNAIKWASRQPDPQPLPMPMQLPWVEHVYKDDDPVTTSPEDVIDVILQVKDDDHGKALYYTGEEYIELSEDFNPPPTCSYNTFPPGWVATPVGGWRCYYVSQLGSYAAVYRYYYNDYATSLLESPVVDLSAYAGLKVEFRHYWQADYSGADYQDGYVEISTNGGVTYPHIAIEFHHNDPARETASYSVPVDYASDQVRLRLRMESGNDWYWFVDDIKIIGRIGVKALGLGEAMGTATIANVPPTIVGDIPISTTNELDSITIEGLEISDPALFEPTEWFAYRFNYDDGTPAPWIYKGSLAAPKLKVLFIHSMVSDPAGLTAAVNMLESLDLVDSVTPYDYFSLPPTAPSLSLMMEHDLIILGMNSAWIDYEPWEICRRQTGDRLAAYLESGRGGFISFFGPYTNDARPGGYGPIWDLLGRFRDWDYGPWERADMIWAPSTLGPIFEPDHEVMQNVRSGQVEMLYIHMGDNPITIGGLGIATGRDGLNLADTVDNMRAVAVKELTNGARVVAIGAYAGPNGADMPVLTRNAIGWAIGGIPTPKIPPVTHTFGDNGKYNVDISIIDDDMGWTWDFVNNEPVAHPMYSQSIAHRHAPIEVMNVDPTIHSIGAFADSELCIRLSGNKGNTATLTLIGTDGTYESVSTTREPGKPQVACLPTVTIDMTPATKYTLNIEYDPKDDGGANPEWIFQSTWPGGKVKELRRTFDSSQGHQVWVVNNKQFKRLAIGSDISFEIDASDPGSDDLAVAWVWGDLLPYDLHIYRHPGVFYTYAVSDELSILPFNEPRFDYNANDERSPEADPIMIHDTAVHAFDEDQLPQFLYVMVIVADDDVGDPYPTTYLIPGMDLEVIQLDW